MRFSRRVTACVQILVAAAALVPAVLAVGRQNAQVPPQFRSAVTLVPVDVRVIDRQGRPITDLKQEDFTILENGVPQQIRHFSLQMLTPQAPASVPLSVAGAPTATPGTLTPQDRRLFLIVLGRGRLQEPSKGMDAVVRFVREQLLPQDQVAVFAYDRATRFIADHDLIGQVLERYRRLHTGIEAMLALRFSGLAAVYGSRAVPAAVQKEIDRIFDAPAAAGSRQVIPQAPADSSRIGEDTRKASDATLQAMVLAEQAKLGPISPLHTELEQLESQQFTDLPFEEFVSRNAGTMQDLGKIYTGIEYLRHFEGEKHLIFVTEYGLAFLRGDDVDRLAQAANDARVVIDNIQTGGVLGGFAAFDLRSLSTTTGGQASISEYSRKGFDRVDQATRATYLLGYYPSKATGDGRYRRIQVKVNRSGVSVLFRHGYYARSVAPVFERRAFFTDSRVMSAALYRADVRDIALKVEASEVPARVGGGKDVLVNVTIDASRVSFAPLDDTQQGFLDVVVFFADTRKVVIDERWQQIDMKLPAASHARVLKEGIPYTLRMPKKPGVRIVKVVVYDYQADLLGSAEAMVK